MLTEADTHLTVPAGRLETEVSARQLRAAIEERNDTGERGNGWPVAAPGAVEAQIRRAGARRAATRVGRGMLAAIDLDTARHTDDVVLLAGAICHVVGIRGAERQDVLAAAHLHDIGKAAVPREVIEKPGPLSQSEWRLMRAHTEVGARILSGVPELGGIARLVYHSHERWDGNGYPDGLGGLRIPLGSRVIFCADAFQAIRADRAYRRGRSAAYALAELRACSGTQFDPEIVVALERVARELRAASPTPRVRRSDKLTALLLGEQAMPRGSSYSPCSSAPLTPASSALRR